MAVFYVAEYTEWAPSEEIRELPRGKFKAKTSNRYVFRKGA